MATLLLTAAATAMAQPWQGVSGPPAGVAATAVGAGHGDTIYAGFGSSGVYRSTNNGVSWVAVNSGLADAFGGILQANAFVRTGSGAILRGGAIASFNNGVGSAVWRSTDGVNWTQVPYPFDSANIGLAGSVNVINFTRSGGSIFASDTNSHGIWRSTNDGLNWSAAATGIPTAAFVGNRTIYNLAAHDGTLYAATAINGIWRSGDDGASWIEFNTGIPGSFSGIGTVRAARDVAALPDGTLFAAVDDVIYRRRPGDTAWEESDPTLFGALRPAGYARRVTTHGPDVFVAGDVGGNTVIAESADGGETWRFVGTAGLPGGVADITSQSFLAHNDALYLALGSGLYRTALGTVERLPFAPQLSGGGTVNANAGGTAILGAAVNRATSPLIITWERNGHALPGQNGLSLTLTRVSEADDGAYTLTVANAGGSASVTFTLAVFPVGPGLRDYTFSATFAQQYSWVSGAIERIVPTSGRQLLLAGEFTTANGLERPRIVRLLSDGRVAPDYDNSGGYPAARAFSVISLGNGQPFIGYDSHLFTGASGSRFIARLRQNGLPDSSFNVDESAGTIFYSGSKIYALAEQDDGRVLAGGRLFRGGILRFHPNGTLDGSWPDGAISSSTDIFAMALVPDRKVLIGGSFTSVRGNSSYRRLARLNLADGSIDTTFNPNLNSTVRAIRVQADGRILAAGQTFIVRLLADGTADPTFALGGDGPNAMVRTLALQEDGKILAGGDFSSWNGQSAHARLVRLHPDGALDTSFSPSVSGNVYSLHIQPDGHVVAGGTTTAVTPQAFLLRIFGDQVDPAIHAQPRDLTVDLGAPAMLAVDADSASGALAYQWRKGGQDIQGANSATLAFAETTRADGGIYSVLVTSPAGSRLSQPARLDVLAEPVIAVEPEHRFVQAGANVVLTVQASGVAPLSYRWLKDGAHLGPANATPELSLDNVSAANEGEYRVEVSNSLGTAESRTVALVLVFPPGTRDAAFATGTGANSTVRALAATGFKSYAGGDFTTFNGQNRDRLVRLNADGTVDSGFVPPGGVFTEVRALVVQGDGKLVAGGVSGSATILRRFLADGSLDAGFTPPAFGNGGIQALAVQPDGSLLVGGSFTTVAGAAAGRLARLRPDGSLDSGFLTGSGFDNTVFALARQGDGRILVGGQFTTYGGVPAAYLARLLPDGARDPEFSTVTNAFNNTVRALAVQTDGRILVGGNFTSVGGVASRAYLSRFLPGGGVDPEFTANSINGAVFALAAHPSGKILAAGSFTYFANDTRNRIAAFLPDGSVDSQFPSNPGANNTILALAVTGQGKVVLGGQFTTYSNATVNYLTRIEGHPATLQILTQPQSVVADSGADIVLSILADSPRPLQYQWHLDDEPIQGANSATLALTTVTTAANGIYRVTIGNVFGEMQSAEAFVVVRAAPVIVAQPRSRTVDEGANVVFDVRAFGVEPLAYQWFLDGVEVPGADGPALPLPAVGLADQGEYTVEVSNAIGTVISQPATLTVIQPAGGPVLQALFRAAPNVQVQAMRVMPDRRVLVAFNNRVYRYLADGTLDNTFANLAFNNTIYGVWAQADGKVLVGGNFTWVGNTNIARFVRLNTDGTLDETFLPGGSTSGISNIVMDAAVQDDGRIIIVGLFSQVGGQVRGHIARLLANGGPDPSLDTGSGFATTFGAPSMNTVLLLPDGRIVAGGNFFTYNGSSSRGIAVLLPDGRLDPSFAPVGDYVPNKLALSHDGSQLLAAGNATTPTYRGVPVGHAVRINLDGSLDQTFVTGTSDAGASLIAVSATGGVALAGAFTVFAGQVSTGMVVLLPDGRRDTRYGFQPGFTSSAAGNLTMIGVQYDVTGNLLVGGNFTHVNGVDSPYLARLHGVPVNLAITAQPQPLVRDHGQNAEFGVDIYTTSTAVYQWFKDDVELPGEDAATLLLTNVTADDSAVYRVEIANNDAFVASRGARLRVLVEPEIERQPVDVSGVLYGSVTLQAQIVGAAPLAFQWYRNGVAVDGAEAATVTSQPAIPANAGFYHLEARNAFGTVRTDTVALLLNAQPGAPDTLFLTGTGFNSGTSAVVILDDGRIVVGGSFTEYNGIPVNRLAALFADGSLDTSFAAGFGSTVTLSDVRLDRNGRILVSGGNFGTVQGAALSALARFDANGALDAEFAPVTNGQVMRVLPLADGRIVIGGQFTQVNGVGSVGLAILGEDGTLDEGFTSPLASTSTPMINSLAVDADGNLLFGGLFRFIGSTTVYYAGRASPAGVSDNTFRNNVFQWLKTNVVDMVPLADGKVLLASANLLRRANANGTRDMAMNMPGNGTVNRIIRENDGRLFIAGTHNRAWPLSGTTSLDRLSADGAVDETYPLVVLNNGAAGMARDSLNRMVLVGGFTQAHGAAAGYITRVLGDGPAVAVATLSPSLTVTAGDGTPLEVIAVGTGALSYQWYRGLSGDTADPVDGGTARMLQTPPLFDTGLYWVRVADVYGAVDSDTIVVGVISPPTLTVVPDSVTLGIDAAAPDLLAGVSAADYQNTDLTGAVVLSVDGPGFVDTATPGVYTVTYSVSDADGRPAQPKTRVYTVVDDVPPVISVEPTAVVIPVGFPVDVRAGVGATDNWDGDLTAQVVVGSAPLQLGAPGAYTVTYGVADAAGNQAVQRVRVYHVVLDVTPPELSVAPDRVVLAVGAVLAPLPDEGVSAVDDIDGDLTAAILISGGIPDTATAGIHTVVYTVVDFSGNVAEATRTYFVRNVPLVDSDGDGMDDDWEILHFGDLRLRGDDDADGDGRDNLAEFWYGSDPRGYTIALRPGWNLVSLFHLPPERAAASILVDSGGHPAYSGSAWAWNGARGIYQAVAALPAHTAVWVFAPVAATVEVQLP